jgi:Protein of unknown function (DUF4231)
MSETESQLEYLSRQIQERLTQREQSVRFYRKRHYRYQIAAVVLSAAITVVSGLKAISGFKHLSIPAEAASDLTLVLGAISTVAAAFGGFFAPQQSWHLNAEIYGRLRALQVKLEFLERGREFANQQDQTVAELFREYQSILDEYNRKWQELRQKSK